MAWNETKVTMSGRVCTDISTRAADGTVYASFTLAANERKYDKVADTWGDGQTIFMRVRCWRRLAENVASSLGKGDPIVVTGKLVSRRVGAEGHQRTEFELDASNLGPDLCQVRAVIDRQSALRETAGRVAA